MRFDTRSLFSFDFPKLFEVPVGNALPFMLFLSCLDVPGGVYKVFDFSKTFKFDLGSSINLLPSKIEEMFLLSTVRFYLDRACLHLYRVKTCQLMRLGRLHLGICKTRGLLTVFGQCH